MPSRGSAIARPDVCSLAAFGVRGLFDFLLSASAGISGLRYQVSALFLAEGL